MPFRPLSSPPVPILGGALAQFAIASLVAGVDLPEHVREGIGR